MYFGELKEKSPDYVAGHNTGSVRAYDDVISWFEEIAANEKKGTRHTTVETLAMLKYCKENWIHFCETYGMGDPDQDDEVEDEH